VPKTTLIDEEQRGVLYATSYEPTVRGSVTPDTPLDSLNLNWREKDLPEGERTKHVHRLHPCFTSRLYLAQAVPESYPRITRINANLK
jgi:hypothetical protein